LPLQHGGAQLDPILFHGWGTFTSLPPDLRLFTHIGLADTDFKPKPALAAWDELHRRRLAP
jgi:hypothetical protein